MCRRSGEPMLPVEDQGKDMSEQAVVRQARAALRGYKEWRASHPLSSSVCVATRPQTVKSLCFSVIPGSVMLTHTVLEGFIIE